MIVMRVDPWETNLHLKDILYEKSENTHVVVFYRLHLAIFKNRPAYSFQPSAS